MSETEIPNTSTTSYDTVQYPSRCFPQTHADHLSTIATLLGMEPVESARCKVLEFGCGAGSNIIPMAFAHPASKFIGVDLAPTAIKLAQDDANGLGLKNIEFHCADLLDWTPPPGDFDYIIAHGFFSWVPEPVRRRALQLCSERLAAHGVALISYNALPGFHVRAILREMMLFHTRDQVDPASKITKAKEFLHLLIAGQTADTKLTALIREEAQKVLDRNDDSVLFHDDLSTFNQPYYFHEFAALAAEYGLQFLAEADFSDMQDSGHPPAVMAALRQMDHDIVEKEQYLDFLKCRRFRQTLLCRAEVKIQRVRSPEMARKFLVASRAKPKSRRPSMEQGVAEEFVTRIATMRVSDSLAKAAIVELFEHWPRAYTFDELLHGVHRRLGLEMSDATTRDGALCEIILEGFAGGLLELHLHQPNWDVGPGKRPVLSPLVRFQLESNKEFITSLRGTNTRVDLKLRAIYLLMDGSRDHAGIANELRRLSKSGVLPLPANASPQQLQAEVHRFVREAARAGLLLAWDDSK